MAYRPALLYLLSGLATISVSTHTSTNTVTCTQHQIMVVSLGLVLCKPESNSFFPPSSYSSGTNLCHQYAPEKRPYDVPEVQQHHVFKEQSWKSKLRDKVPQTLSLILCDDVGPTNAKRKTQGERS